MKRRRTTKRKTKIRGSLCAALALFLWAGTAGLWKSNEDLGRYMTGYYREEVLTAKEAEAFWTEQEKEERPLSAAGWKEKRGQIFRGEYSKEITGTLWEVWGNMEILWGGVLEAGNFPWKEDSSGCAVSGKLAWELFGTREAVGNPVYVGERRYFVRAVVDSEEKFLAAGAVEETGITGIRLEEKGPGQSGAEGKVFLTQMTGREPDGFFEGTFYNGISRIGAVLPFWLFGVFFWRELWKRVKEREKNVSRLCFFCLLWAGLCLSVGTGLLVSFRFSGDYLPSMWSDLSFYPQLIAQKKEELTALSGFGLCQEDKNLEASMYLCLGGGAGSCFFGVLGKVLLHSSRRGTMRKSFPGFPRTDFRGKRGKGERLMGITVKEFEVVYFDENGERKGEVDFPALDQETVEIRRTFVDSSLRGTGMAGKLMEAAARQIQKQGKKAVLTCSYAENWFEKHKEYQELVKK